VKKKIYIYIHRERERERERGYGVVRCVYHISSYPRVKKSFHILYKL